MFNYRLLAEKSEIYISSSDLIPELQNPQIQISAGHLIWNPTET